MSACATAREPQGAVGAPQRLREKPVCQYVVVGMGEEGSNLSQEGRRARPREKTEELGSQLLLTAVSKGTHCSLQPSQAPADVSPNLALKQA